VYEGGNGDKNIERLAKQLNVDVGTRAHKCAHAFDAILRDSVYQRTVAAVRKSICVAAGT
jgi:hypothetical protein